ncbi:MAG TPA: glutamate--tRNA ligase [Candidatus Saccharimonadales bacterium]|nr:glutamate--tRNA ligase [Candidatus Saccharimonadales bacterium]
MTVRTRFAPSPTGFLHVGGVRTALFAWLVARQANGEFLLRIEDTDRERHIEEAERHILDSLKWLGLDWSGEIYRQSEQLDTYKEWAQKLIDKGRAYTDPRSADEVSALRANSKLSKKPFLFRDHRLDNPPGWNGSQPLRLKSEPKAYQWHDEVMGDLSTGPEVIDDFILMKSDGYPTYDFAHIVDDHLMGISHVMRSQEFASSTPKYLNLYEALEIEHPKLALLPYVLAPDGKKKLSKRDGAKDVLHYMREGFLPEALINFLATLGWNDGTEQEIFSVDELIKKFSLERVQKSGAKFDEQRLEWMNGHYIRHLPLNELYAHSMGFWLKSTENQPDKYKKAVLALVQERLKYLSELPKLTNFFFEDLPIDLKLIDGNKQLSNLSRGEQINLLEKAKERLSESDFSSDSLTKVLNDLLEETGQKPGVLFSLIRIATTWADASPGLAETLSLLGKDKGLERLQRSIVVLEHKS